MKRSRRRGSEKKALRIIEVCNEVIDEYSEQGLRLTLRQLYYQLVTKNIIVNEEKSYKKLGKYVSDARLAGRMDWDAIEDRGRQPRIQNEFESLSELVDAALSSYRLPRWKGQKYYAELWVEKEALAGVLRPLASEFHVTMMVNKGYCVAPGTKVLTDDLRWVPAEQVMAGDGLIGVDENVPGYRKHRRMRLTRVRSTTNFRSPRVLIVTDKGSITVSTNHPFLATKYPRPEVNGYSWVEAGSLKPGCRIAFLAKPWEIDTSWEAGWLAGMYDGEGCLPRTTVTPVALVYQNPGAVADKLRDSLTQRGWLSGERGQYAQRTRVREFVTHGVGQILTLLGTLRPVRLLEEFQRQVVQGHYPAKGKVSATVQAVEPLKEGPVIGIETDTGTLVTEGFVSHNSSQSAMYESANRFLSYCGDECEEPRQPILFYLGDHDPSGEDMVDDIEKRLVMFGVGDIEVRKLALTTAQKDRYRPPPNPAKTTDSRFKKYAEKHGHESWEVDALPPTVLARIIRSAFDEIVDRDKMDDIRTQEHLDKQLLTTTVKELMKKKEEKKES